MTHTLLALLTVPLATSCLLAPGQTERNALEGSSTLLQTELPSPFEFDAARSDLVLRGDDEGRSTVQELLRAYGEVTGQVVILEPGALQRAGHHIPALGAPAARVQAHVEQLLTLHGLTLCLQPGESPRTVIVGEALAASAPPPYVALEELRQAGHHPAVPVMTSVTIQHIDARQLANSLRALMTDRSMQLVPTSERGIMLVGRAPGVLHLASLVHGADMPPSLGSDDPSGAGPAATRGAQNTQAVRGPESLPMEVQIFRVQHDEASRLADVVQRVLDCVARAAHPTHGGHVCSATPDVRTNSLLVTAPEDQSELVRQLVEALDQPVLEAGQAR